MTQTSTLSGLLLSAAILAACGGGGGGGGIGPDGGGGGGGGGCSLVGTWHFTVGSPPLASTYQAQADGSALLTFGSAPAQSGTWMVDPDRIIHIVDTTSTSKSCGQSVVGTYQLTFTADCGAVTFTLLADSCAGRAQVVNGLTMTRD
jgi:hypothetical protein